MFSASFLRCAWCCFVYEDVRHGESKKASRHETDSCTLTPRCQTAYNCAWKSAHVWQLTCRWTRVLYTLISTTRLLHQTLRTLLNTYWIAHVCHLHRYLYHQLTQLSAPVRQLHSQRIAIIVSPILLVFEVTAMCWKSWNVTDKKSLWSGHLYQHHTSVPESSRRSHQMFETFCKSCTVAWRSGNVVGLDQRR